MSSFICSPDHFKALAIFATSRGEFGPRVDPRYVEGLSATGSNPSQAKLATLYADTLFQENIRSVRARYPDDRRDNLPGPTILPLRLVVSNADICNPGLMMGFVLDSPIAILKMCACLDYQSCETDDWSDTVAYRLLERIKDAAIQALPGYDDAPSHFSLPALARAA